MELVECGPYKMRLTTAACAKRWLVAQELCKPQPRAGCIADSIEVHKQTKSTKKCRSCAVGEQRQAVAGEVLPARALGVLGKERAEKRQRELEEHEPDVQERMREEGRG